jgi:hypothetical protein
MRRNTSYVWPALAVIVSLPLLATSQEALPTQASQADFPVGKCIPRMINVGGPTMGKP